MTLSANEGLGLGLGFVLYTRSMSGKRIAISSNMETDSTPMLKKHCGEKMVINSKRSHLEALPQDILIRVLCGVDHDDLKQLFHVSKSIREATMIAKKLHFEYSTPKKIAAFRNSIDFDDEPGDFGKVSVPNAPKRQPRLRRPRLSEKKLAGISVALFPSPCEELWGPSQQLFMEMETDT